MTRRFLYLCLVFGLTFVSYALFHATRLTLSKVKPDLRAELGFSQSYLGTLDTLFLGFYSAGLYVSGRLGDRFSLRVVLVTGMLLTGGLTIAFGLVGLNGESAPPALFAVIWATAGAVQSIGWPTTVAIMGNWLGQGHRGLAFGVWSSCVSVGNIFGGLIASALLGAGNPWTTVFLVPGAMMCAWALVCAVFLKTQPSDVQGLGGPTAAEAAAEASGSVHSPPNFPASPDTGTAVPRRLLAVEAIVSDSSDEDDDNDEGEADDDPFADTQTGVDLMEEVDAVRDTGGRGGRRQRSVGFVEAWRIPGVFVYALTNCFTKLVSYTLLFWLPYYLSVLPFYESSDSRQQIESTADLLSVLFDIGGVVGGISFGYCSDVLVRKGVGRSLAIGPLLILATVSVVLYWRLSTRSLALNAVLMTACGCFSNSAYNLINSCVAADLGAHPRLKGAPKALATVTGIIDGSGSVGAAGGQQVFALILQAHGWDAAFGFLVASCVTAFLCLLPIIARDLKYGVALCMGSVEQHSQYGILAHDVTASHSAVPLSSLNAVKNAFAMTDDEEKDDDDDDEDGF